MGYGPVTCLTDLTVRMSHTASRNAISENDLEFDFAGKRCYFSQNPEFISSLNRCFGFVLSPSSKMKLSSSGRSFETAHE